MILRLRRITTSIAAALVAVIIGQVPVFAAEPTVKVIHKYYDLSGRTDLALKRQVQTLGPGGFWAFTRWKVSWSPPCKVRLKIIYTFPRLTDRNSVPLSVRNDWDAMMVRLTAHEEKHGQNGLNAAREILAADCQNAQAISKKWANKDRLLDQKTQHGKTQGVDLRG